VANAILQNFPSFNIKNKKHAIAIHPLIFYKYDGKLVGMNSVFYTCIHNLLSQF